VLFQPEDHEALAGEPWSDERARAGIRAIVADIEAAYDDGWPGHPRDGARDRLRTIYLGGAGVVEALRRLADAGLVDLGRDYLPYLVRSVEAEPDVPDPGAERSLWMGEAGIRLVLQRLAPSPENLRRLAELIAQNARDERRELMWGSVGTILAGRELGLDVSESVDWLQAQRDADGLWTQELYGKSLRYLGPAHGFAGCALALGDPERVPETLRPFAVVEDGLANWPAVAGQGIVPADGRIRTQWCHGAPGIVSTLAPLLDEEVALAGGNLTWAAGPLRKGANLCHGTAGNGYALLALFALTGDEEWLARARAFGMHALAQLEQARVEYGRGWYTLWTGDAGAALYLCDCLDGTHRLPLP
jgi:Lanthionine synthetase C-like protein